MATLALFLALLLALSGAHKFIEAERMGAAAARLAGVPRAAGDMLSIAAATVEIAAGLALVLPGLQLVGGVLAALLWSVYGLALLRRYGAHLDCGCTFAARSKPVGLLAIARAAGLAALAVAIAAGPAASLSIETPFAAAALLALYLAAGELAAIPTPQRRRA